MSAYKTAYIRLGENEYKRLREAEEQLRLNNLLNKKTPSNRDMENQSIYENMLGITKQNDENFQNLVVDLAGEVSRIENEASFWVENQVSQITSDYDQYRQNLENDVSKRIDHIVSQANRQLLRKENELQEFWKAQEARFSSIENKWQEYARQGLDLINSNQQILDFIYETYSIDPQTGNQLEQMREFLNQTIHQFNNGFYEIAAPAAFQIFNGLSNIRFQLEVDRAVQRIEYQNLLDRVQSLEETIISNQSVYAMDSDGNELSEIINVDYWVEGRYLEFTQKFTKLMNDIVCNENIGLNDIREYQNLLNKFNGELVDLITQARIVVLASQLRFNVAQIVVQSLEEQGFFLQEANYEKDDFRESFVAKTSNLSGNEVIICIEPDPGLDEGGKIHIKSLDADQITQHELLQRNFELFTAIKENGLFIDDIQEVVPHSNNDVQLREISTNLRRGNQVFSGKAK